MGSHVHRKHWMRRSTVHLPAGLRVASLLVPLILTARMLRPEPFRLQAAGGKPGKKRKAG